MNNPTNFLTKQTFGQALEALRQGGIVSRAEWMASGVIFRQVPSMVPADIIPRMTSLPPAVKAMAASRNLPLRYQNQFAVLTPYNDVRSWSPSIEDIEATDWIIDPPHVIASDTVGTATPLE